MQIRQQTFARPVATIGIDTKNTLRLVGLDKRGSIVLRTKVSRNQLAHRLANLPRCLVGLDAGCGAHHIARFVVVLAPAERHRRRHRQDAVAAIPARNETP